VFRELRGTIRAASAMLLQRKEKVEILKHYFGEGGLSIICSFSLFGGHWNVHTAKSESGLYLISVEL
jgi:hypothetical protein